MLNILFFFFFNDTATTEIYTLSLHDAIPISIERSTELLAKWNKNNKIWSSGEIIADVEKSVDLGGRRIIRSEEHTSELQSHSDLVCRLLLEKKKNKT